jgi:toxin ParE1/3/4
MYEPVFSNEARDDIVGILQYTQETFGIRQKNIYENYMKAEIEKLSLMPTIGHKHSFLNEMYRVINFQSHLIIYTVNQAQKQINILRIVHKKVDLQGLL